MKIKYSSTKKIIKKYEKNLISNYAFNDFLSKPYLRTFMQLFMKSFQEKDYSQTIEEFSNFIKDKLEISLGKPLFIDIICKNCKSVIDLYNPYNQKKPIGMKLCSNCRNNIELSECEEKYNWVCSESFLYQLLEDLYNLDIIKKEWYGICQDCSESNTINCTTNPISDDVDLQTIKNYALWTIIYRL